MLTYQVRPRVLRITGDQKPEFPADVEVSLHFQPLQPFGKAPGGGLTTVRSQPGRVFFNANTGQHFVESKSPLAPLEIEIEEPTRLIALEGNRVTIKERCEDYKKFTDLLESLYFGLPLLLAVEFADPPTVERVDGQIGSVPFRWELSDWRVELDITTQEQQEQRFATAWNRFDILSAPQRRRLIAALHYFHVACRVKREGKTPGEFLAEALLNFHKVLEVLYGPSRDQVRTSLAKLEYTAEEIERDFIPSMLLRNSIDVGHPMLALFTLRQLETLHRYADRAERAFRGLLQRLFQAIEAGRLDIPPYETNHVDAETQRTIETLRQRLDQLGDRP
jgi:hypothetical protein